jgi:hypothetical protein
VHDRYFYPASERLPEGWQPLVQAVVKVVRIIDAHTQGNRTVQSRNSMVGEHSRPLRRAVFKAPFAAIGPLKTRTIMSVMS